jgi:hypothetical protein
LPIFIQIHAPHLGQGHWASVEIESRLRDNRRSMGKWVLKGPVDIATIDNSPVGVAHRCDV